MFICRAHALSLSKHHSIYCSSIYCLSTQCLNAIFGKCTFLQIWSDKWQPEPRWIWRAITVLDFYLFIFLLYALFPSTAITPVLGIFIFYSTGHIESQNNRKVWVGSDLERSFNPRTCRRTGHPSLHQVARLFNLTLNTSRDGASTSLGNPFQCLTTLIIKNVFPITEQLVPDHLFSTPLPWTWYTIY